MINKNNDDTLFMIVMFIQMRITFKFTLILLLLKNACSFMNLQENLHNAVHKKKFIFSNSIAILNALFNSSKYKQIHWYITCSWKHDQCLLEQIWSDALNFCMWSQNNHSHSNTLIYVLIVILCFVNLLHK